MFLLSFAILKFCTTQRLQIKYPHFTAHQNKPNVISLIELRATSYLDIVNNKFLKAIRHHVSCPLVAAITNAWHQILPLKSSSNSVVNTLWLSPVFLKTKTFTKK